MWVKFIEDYGIFKAGETCDMLRRKAAELSEQGIITVDPKAVRERSAPTNTQNPIPKEKPAVVPSHQSTTVEPKLRKKYVTKKNPK